MANVISVLNNVGVGTLNLGALKSALDERAEIVHGFKTGTLHGMPLLATFLSAKLFLSSTSVHSLALPLLFTLQILATMYLACFGPKLSKGALMIVKASVLLGGISNGLILSILMN